MKEIKILNRLIEDVKYYYKPNRYFDCEITQEVLDQMETLGYELEDLYLFDAPGPSIKIRMDLTNDYKDYVIKNDVFLNLEWVLEELEGIEFNGEEFIRKET